MMNIIFIGSGYVGLVSGTMLAYLGHKIVCIDSDETKIKALQNHELPIYEPELDEYFRSTLLNGTLSFATDYKSIKIAPDAIFITVGTPSMPNGEADLQYVINATLEAASNTAPDTAIVIKSTVPPGTTRMLEALVREKGYKHEIISNPEFLREGNAIKDFISPDRIVIGTENERSIDLMEKIYDHFIQNNHNILFTSQTSAELAKYASNAFLATKIAFINEMANLCEKTGADVDLVATALGMDPRIGRDFLKTGPGFGGSCFPKDILALEYLAKVHEEPCYVLSAVIQSNKKRSKDIVFKIKMVLGDLHDKMIAVFGLTFKAGTDDVRSSPAIDIVKLLAEEGAYICAYDPEGMKNASAFLNIDMANSYKAAAHNSDAIVILTEWPEFTKMDYAELSCNVREKIIFDYRNILNPAEVRKAGFKIYQLGK
jgi:UDPglucose 6-dehydrogenase